jgi:hypothetical protein
MDTPIMVPLWEWLMLGVGLLFLGCGLAWLGVRLVSPLDEERAKLKERALHMAMTNYPHLRQNDVELIKHAKVLERYLAS